MMPNTSQVDASTALITVVIPLITNLVNQQDAPKMLQGLSSASTILDLSSPPPPYEMELTLCMYAFSKTQLHISSGAITSTISRLDDAGFSPDTIGDVSMGHTREVTGFLEGQIPALHKFV